MLFIIYLCYTNHYIQYEYNMALHFFLCFYWPAATNWKIAQELAKRGVPCFLDIMVGIVYFSMLRVTLNEFQKQKTTSVSYKIIALSWSYEQLLHRLQMSSNRLQKSYFSQLLLIPRHSCSWLFSLSFGQVTKPTTARFF